MRAEDIKAWLRGIEEEEDPEAQGKEGAGDRWLVLIPKGGGGYRGIGLLEPIWKVLEAVMVMDGRLNIVDLHDCLHGYRKARGTGTGILEAKLAQQLAYLEQCPLYGIFIDLRKAFDAMD
ncbi:hypothetical protein ACHAWF_012112, partial [Thalassiosira exigua]